MDETIQKIYEEAELRCRESLVRHISILEKLTRTASYFPQIILNEENESEELKLRRERKEKLKQKKERREKIILYLKSHQQSTVKEIAQELDLPEKTAGMILGRMEEWLYNEIVVTNGKITREYSLM